MSEPEVERGVERAKVEQDLADPGTTRQSTVEQGTTEQGTTEQDTAAQGTRRVVVRWSLVIGGILVLFAITVATLNATVYSASGFVSSYLGSLARHDVSAALDTRGVALAADTEADLLEASALGELSDIRLVSDADRGVGLHTLTYAFELDGTASETTFDVQRDGSIFALFARWSFATSPIGVLQVTPVNVDDFDANGVEIMTGDAPGVGSSYSVLVPAVVSLSQQSAYTEADPESILLIEPLTVTVADVSPRASDDFVDLVQGELDSVLDDCATQTVLQPTGCPFGRTITNRIEGQPEWTIEQYPAVTILPGSTPGTWEMPETVGVANIRVAVRSLFDGSVTTIDDDVQFNVSYLMTLPDDGNVTITAQ